MRYTDPTGNRICEDADCQKTITAAQVHAIAQQVQTPASSRDDQGPSGNATPSNSIPRGVSLSEPAPGGGGLPLGMGNNAASDDGTGQCPADYCEINFGINVGWILKGVVVAFPESEPITGPLSEFVTKAGVTIGGNYIWDDYGNKYGGIWGGLGKSPLPVNWNLVHGIVITNQAVDWLQTDYLKGVGTPAPRATEAQVRNFVTGPSFNVAAGIGVSWGGTLSRGGLAFETGTFTPPQVSVSGGGNWSLPMWLPPQ